MSSDRIQEELLSFISSNFAIERNAIELDASLINQGIIDSFGLIELSAFLQKTFDIVVDDEDLNRANFGSLLKIVDYVARKMASGQR